MRYGVSTGSHISGHLYEQIHNTFKNTDKLIEDKKQILKTDPDAIIKNNKKMIILKS